MAWAAEVAAALEHADRDLHWITRDQRTAWERSRPDLPGDHRALKAFQKEHPQAHHLVTSDLRHVVDAAHSDLVPRTRLRHHGFFDRIESKPLTAEQAAAVITTDNRVQVVAAAGSGKTSVMVARAAWAVKHLDVPADQILLLAFNRAAAAELQERIDERFRATGLDPAGVRATTFHAFGLDVIGQSTGRKPRLAGWLDSGQDVAMVGRIVDELRNADPAFRHRWDLYRLLFARIGDDQATVDGYDAATSATGYRTMKGEVVKSQGERLVADWLFLNAVDYRYEHPYVHDVADAEHSQYRPDFFYPGVEVWHEHWALDAAGRPPAEFVGYAESMRWKKALHQQHGTVLIETTWSEILDATGFAPLADELTSLGLVLDWNPDRATTADPVRHDDLWRLMRTFMAHVKSNGHTRESLGAAWLRGGRSYRTRLFLDLYWPIHDRWQARLKADDSVDFEDMLVTAVELVEAGHDPGFTTVLVDEFQDASPARARLARALVAAPHRHLVTVGDDWQSINRFAGADISVMTTFEQWFGESRNVHLTTTFRCARTIAETAAAFVQCNPRQIRKAVHAVRDDVGTPLALVRVATENDLARSVDGWLQDLSRQVAQNGGEKVSVDVLGRYSFERDLLPRSMPSNLDVTFRTVHGSKGLEADHILVPRMLTGRYGFPSTIADDPVLDLVMSDDDQFPHGEERRLFYVALTRARTSVTLMTVAGRESPFVTELVAAGLLDEHHLSSLPASVPCPTCGQGTLVRRTGRFGEFLGCSAFPRCRHTAKL